MIVGHDPVEGGLHLLLVGLVRVGGGAAQVGVGAVGAPSGPAQGRKSCSVVTTGGTSGTGQRAGAAVR